MERLTPSPAAETPEAKKPPRKAKPAPRADVAAAPPPADPPRPAADKSASATSSVNIEAFAKNIARMVEQGGRALAAYLKPREEGR
ncbi:MAG TPA: class I poly(R)-hydroxyalkanoic acid synthase, partial [Xanthobacteraceae bacterium]|nr:class I poly(R)-hydroxyalkanoic acid synthase [Xanthobacteraceae bacterium]